MLRGTCVAKLKAGDSLTFYQCHVLEATQELTTADGMKIKGKSKKYTVTEKYVVINKTGSYKMKYFTSNFTDCPNGKFGYLKVREKDYWNFKLTKDTLINEHDVMTFGAIEVKAHDTTEYDFRVTSANPNALIITGNKIMRHLVINGDHLLRKNLDAFK